MNAFLSNLANRQTNERDRAGENIYLLLGMCGIYFFKFQFGFGSVFEKKLGFSSEWVWFGLVQKTLFGSDIIVIYSCNSKYYNDSGWHDYDVADVTHNNDNKQIM